jgi:hypothetical protein
LASREFLAVESGDVAVKDFVSVRKVLSIRCVVRGIGYYALS